MSSERSPSSQARITTRGTTAERELPPIASGENGDRDSVTDVNGTVAHFEMAYNPAPKERFVFGPTLWQRLPSLIFLGFALTIDVIVLLGTYGGGGTAGRWVMDRSIPPAPMAFVIFLCAAATVLRASLRGVIVTRDGVEARYILPGGIPRIRKWGWSQIDRVVLDDDDVLFELWDGTYERLPKVADGKGLATMLERVARGRNRQVTRLPKT